MFEFLSFTKIIGLMGIGILLFGVAVGIFFLVAKQRQKKVDSKDYLLFGNDDFVQVTKPKRKEMKKREKENKLLLSYYEKQLEKGEITPEEYFYNKERILNPHLYPSEPQTEVPDTTTNHVEEQLYIEEDNNINQLFVDAELRLENQFMQYYVNTVAIYELSETEVEKMNDLLEEKKSILYNMLDTVEEDINMIGHNIEGLLNNRYEIKNLITSELKDINLLEKQVWDDETCSLYYLEPYVLVYLENHFENN